MLEDLRKHFRLTSANNAKCPFNNKCWHWTIRHIQRTDTLSHIHTLSLYHCSASVPMALHGYPAAHDYQWTGQTKLIKVPSEMTPCCHLVQGGRKESGEDELSYGLHADKLAHQICMHVIMHATKKHCTWYITIQNCTVISLHPDFHLNYLQFEIINLFIYWLQFK